MNHLSVRHLITKCAGTYLVRISVNVNKGITMSAACVKIQNYRLLLIVCNTNIYIMFFIDVDECENNLNNCSYMCINLNGSYYCVCDYGFSLQDDEETCHSRCYNSVCL